jgi:hypothetical protein
MLIQKNIEIDSLHELVSLQEESIENKVETMNLLTKKCETMNELLSNEKNKQIVFESERKSLKRMVNKRNITILALAILNSAQFIYCLSK